MPVTPDLYSLLGLTPDADAEDIKSAYKKAVLNVHPDRNRASWSTALFRCVTEASDVLSDPAKRCDYDVWRARQASRKPQRHRGRPKLHQRPETVTGPSHTPREAPSPKDDEPDYEIRGDWVSPEVPVHAFV